VDASTLDRKLMAGYQGWFTASGDGSPYDGQSDPWHHWSIRTAPTPANTTFDLWPDLSEFGADELHPTGLHYADDRVAALYSAFHRATVFRHTKWLADYGLDGFFLQRFFSDLRNPRGVAFRDRVAEHVRDGCERYGRVFAMEYDISGATEATLVDDIKRDWQHLVDDLKLTRSERYLRHRGRPVLTIWGFGFSDRPGSPEQAQTTIDWLTRDAPEPYRVTLIGGIPSRWRQLRSDSKTDPAWAAVYRRFQVIHPWTVGRYSTDAEVETFRRDLLAPDVAEASAAGIDYLPVIWPGFSTSNHARTQGTSRPLNQIPRRGGALWWKQLYEFVSAGCTTAFAAMFDEVDEGTAIYKAATSPREAPPEPPFLTLGTDGIDLPNDWYLRVAGAGATVLHGEAPLTPALPLARPSTKP
jgi:hypothetical protein